MYIYRNVYKPTLRNFLLLLCTFPSDRCYRSLDSYHTCRSYMHQNIGVSLSDVSQAIMRELTKYVSIEWNFFFFMSCGFWCCCAHILIVEISRMFNFCCGLCCFCAHIFVRGNITHVKFSATSRQLHPQGWWPEHLQHQGQGTPTLV